MQGDHTLGRNAIVVAACSLQLVCHKRTDEG
jgi:hypothetical protein